MTEVIDRKIYRRRSMRGMSYTEPAWAQLGDPDGLPLSKLLNLHVFRGEIKGRLFICGSLLQMDRKYVEEPLTRGWRFARPYIHGFRSPVYSRMIDGAEREISVKLVGESWLPGCEDMTAAIPAWRALKAEWATETQIPLLSTPSKTGQAFLLENLPKGVDFPALPDELARLIRSISPQHRLEVFSPYYASGVDLDVYGHDARWMYVGACLADRLPIGDARKTGGFVEYQPGWYHIRIKIPDNWNHIGLIPRPCEHEGNRVWDYPNKPGEIIQAWVSEPELTLAIQNGWEIVDHIDGYVFDKGRPLLTWAKKLIGMRERLQDQAAIKRRGGAPMTNACDFAASAIREVLNHTIGSFHVDTYEREGVVADAEWKELVARWGYEKVRTLEKLRGGKRRITYPARHSDRLSIYMPHWSAAIWALERAWIAKHVVMKDDAGKWVCDPSVLVEIRGDCVYSTAPLSFKDDGHYSQLRPKGV